MKMRTEKKVFLTRAGGKGEDEEYALDNNLAIIGFREYPSLESMQDYQQVYEFVVERFPDLKKGAKGNYAGQLWAFAVAMQKDDIVVLPRKTTSQIAIGKVTGPYKYQKIAGEYRHTREVEWIRPDVPRTTFDQDLLYSFGAFMTVCTITRNNALKRVEAVMNGQPDPGNVVKLKKNQEPDAEDSSGDDTNTDLAELAHDQIVRRIERKFKGHDLSDLIGAILRAEGWVINVSPPGADGGVDIFAGRGSLGLDPPRLCVQVKSQSSPADVTVFRTLQGSMQTFKAEQGLLVCWGGFNRAVMKEARQSYFLVRLWESRDVVEAIYKNYEKLPAEIQAELPLKRVWMLVMEEEE